MPPASGFVPPGKDELIASFRLAPPASVEADTGVAAVATGAGAGEAVATEVAAVASVFRGYSGPPTIPKLTVHRVPTKGHLNDINPTLIFGEVADTKGADMKIESLRDLFEIELRYIYDCEQKLVKKGLPTMIDSATSPELRSALEQHLQETRNHVSRIERVFSIIGADPKTEGNDILDELTSTAKDMISDIDESLLRDAALIVSGNKLEHYEIGVYGSLVSFAQQLGYQDAASLLQQTLNEEKAADAKLTQLGETVVNPSAGRERRVA